MQKTSLLEVSSYCSGKGWGGEVGRYFQQRKGLQRKKKLVWTKAGAFGAGLGKQWAKSWQEQRCKDRDNPTPFPRVPHPAFSHANSAPSVSVFPWFFWGSIVSFTAQGHLSLCEFLCIPIALRFGLFNSLQTKHLERQHRGQHPLSFAPLPPSSSLSQQMLLTEAMLCALIISYGNSLSLSIKYLWQKQQNNATPFIPKYSANC